MDIRSDLYSLGVMLWEMVTGHALFGGSPAEVMYLHQHEPLPLKELEGVPQPVVVLLEVLLEKDPGRRFQNPAELLKAIPTLTGGLAMALHWAAALAHFERNPAEVERLASDLIELSTHQNFAVYLAFGAVYRGWARSALGHTADGFSWIEDALEDYRATGSMLTMPFWLALKAETLHLADRTCEALEVIKEAEARAERFEDRWWFAELHRLCGVFLTTIGADETQIEASFCTAIRTAREQKSISLAKRAEATYAEYRCQKARALGGHGFRLPLC